jgi:hypothetical protein
MSVHKRFDPSPTIATEAALDMAIKPFIERFVRDTDREKAIAHFVPKNPKHPWGDLAHMIDTTRARPYEPGVLAPWNAVRGVFLVEHEEYSVATQTAMGLYVVEDSLFIAYRATFAVARFASGKPLLLT